MSKVVFTRLLGLNELNDIIDNSALLFFMNIRCCYCKKEIEPVTKIVEFKNLSKHIAANCPLCKRFLKYLPSDKPLHEVVMPFGKYKNEKLINIRSDYLVWLMEKGLISGNLKNQILDILSSRLKSNENIK